MYSLYHFRKKNVKISANTVRLNDATCSGNIV